MKSVSLSMGHDGVHEYGCVDSKDVTDVIVVYFLVVHVAPDRAPWNVSGLSDMIAKCLSVLLDFIDYFTVILHSKPISPAAFQKSTHGMDQWKSTKGKVCGEANEKYESRKETKGRKYLITKGR